jgi:AraC-like DNA-binding protein
MPGLRPCSCAISCRSRIPLRRPLGSPGGSRGASTRAGRPIRSCNRPRRFSMIPAHGWSASLPSLRSASASFSGVFAFVGYGPKTLQRVLRLQRLLGALELGRDQTGGLARIAATIGYSHQGHLTRETRDLSGHSPREPRAGAWRAQGRTGAGEHPLRAGTLARAGTLPEETDSLTLEPGEVVTPTGDDAHPAAVGRGAGSDWRPDLGTFCRRTLR